MWDWLLLPIDPARAHEISNYLAWHARFMTLAWAVLVPIGILAARFFKILANQDWPNEIDNRRWWHTHLACQYTALALMLIAVILIKLAPQIAWTDGVHYLFAWTALALAIVQLGGGLLRGSKGGPTDPQPDGSLRGDHYDMSTRRVAFEYIHKSVGYFALFASVGAIISGLWQANAPHWMWISLPLWWATVIFIFVRLQRRGMCVDTYQALWGPELQHPGNQRTKPVGLGAQRRSLTTNNPQ